MKTLSILTASTMVASLGAAASAAGYDGTKPLTCTPISVVSCGTGGQCDKETATSLNLLQFLRFDFGQSQITGKRLDGEVLKTAIDKVQHVEQRMVLQGTEGDLMWGVMITEDTGDMTLTAGGDKVGFVAFGACTSD